MLALKVEIDGKPFTISEDGNWTLLSADITTQTDEQNSGGGPAKKDRIELRIGAVSQGDGDSEGLHSRWNTLDLELGSSVLISIVETHALATSIKQDGSETG